MCYNWGCKALNHHNRNNSSTIINNSSFNSDWSTSVSGARLVKNYSHAHVASGDVDQCFGNDNQQISGINNGVNITTDTHCQNSDLTSVLSNMNNSLQFLSVRMGKMERSSTPKPSVSPPAATGKDLLQAPAYSCPAITAIPNHITFSDLDLANKNILWTPITSVGVSLPLPLDSCCSLSLVSKAHADIVAQKHPHLKLQSPLPVAVATPTLHLKAIGIMQVHIVWKNGRPPIFSMLVVPHLAWPILFGQNHLRNTQAQTDHAKFTVHFADPLLHFTFSCRDTNPLDAFPTLRTQPSSLTSPSDTTTRSCSANVTCLLTAMPTPSQASSYICLHRGFNKCRPSRMLPECEPSPVQAGVLLSPSQPLPVGNILSGELPDFTEKFYTTIVIKSTKDHLVLPHNANLGSIQPMTSENDKVFSEAADTTADLLADTWLAYAKHTGNGYSNGKLSSAARSPAEPAGTSPSLKSWSLQTQTAEMETAGLDSSH